MGPVRVDLDLLWKAERLRFFLGFVHVGAAEPFRFRLVVFFGGVFSSTLPNASADNVGGFRATLARRS